MPGLGEERQGISWSGWWQILDYIQEQANNDEYFDPADFEDFIEYYQHVWFTRFDPETWCVSDRDRRTNNNVEGHNRKIKQYILQNPSPREFLQGLRDLMIDSCAKFTRDVRQNVVTPPDRSRLSVPLQVALQKLNDDDIDEIEFLEIMASS